MQVRRLSLVRQMLVLQILIILLVLGAVVAVSFAQTKTEYRRSAGDRVLALAETMATEPLVRVGLREAEQRDAIAPVVARSQSISGASYILVLDTAGDVVAAQEPSLRGSTWDLTTSTVDAGTAWVGRSRSSNASAIEAHVPVLDPDSSRVLGYAVVGSESPSAYQQLRADIPDLLLYLGLASALGFAGSALLARRIKRQTLGLEPRDIAGLVEHREALLHGIKEGIIGLDRDHRITLANDEAVSLLDLPPDAVGRTVEDLGMDSDLADALVSAGQEVDRAIISGNRLVTLNRMPVRARQQVIGSVVTLRDRTELVGLQRELDVTRLTADALRAQAHEFTNRLHTISGLLQLKRPERAIEYIRQVHAVHTQLVETVSSQIGDPTLAALIIAKASVAHENAVEFRLSPDARLGEVEVGLAADLETVIGNFLDNAMDAVGGRKASWVELDVRQNGDSIFVVVTDSGPGIKASVMDDLFERGISTKDTSGGPRGIGLALARLVCQRRGGEVSAHNDDGAVFRARIPVPQRPI